MRRDNLKPVRWGVVALVSEPPALVKAFVAHWRSIGASRITLFLDMPDQKLFEELEKVPECEPVLCDDAYWRAHLSERPYAIPGRQKHVLRHTYANTDLDWLFHVDADEFLVSQRPIDRLMAVMDPSVDFATARVAERVFDGAEPADTIFGGVYRRAAHPKDVEEISRIDGPAARLLDRGMAGYPGVKSAFRVGRDLVPAVHSPEVGGGAKGEAMRGAWLLHYDGLTADHWVWKKRRVLAQQPKTGKKRPSMAAQYAGVASAKSDAEARAVYEEAKCLSPERLAALEERGLILRHDLDPRQEAWKLFGRDGLDFRAEAFEFNDIEITPYAQLPRWRQLASNARRRLGI